MSALRRAALEFAQMGWPVFPLVPGKKQPAIPSAHKKDDPLRNVCRGECGRQGHGLYDASTDRSDVRRWWDRWPDANIGLRTGIVVDVLDVDGPAGRTSIMAYCAERDLTLPGGPWAWTPGKHVDGVHQDGDHIYVKATGLPGRVGLLDHVDYRGDGNYVVVPPSVHPDGNGRYEWETAEGRCGGRDVPLEDAPAWLVELVGTHEHRAPTTTSDSRARSLEQPNKAYGEAALAGEVVELAKLAGTTGTRNDRLNYAAWRLGKLCRDGHLKARDVFDALLRVALVIGLSEWEAERTINSGLYKGVIHR